MSRHLQTLFLLAVLSFLFVIPTQAQVTTASMSGTVMFQDEPVIGCRTRLFRIELRFRRCDYDLVQGLRRFFQLNIQVVVLSQLQGNAGINGRLITNVRDRNFVWTSCTHTL